MEFLGIAIIVLVLLMSWSLVKVAGDSDKKWDELFDAFLLREEKTNGNCSEEV